MLVPLSSCVPLSTPLHPTLGLTKRVAFTRLVAADRERWRRPRPPRPFHSINEQKEQRRWDSRRRHLGGDSSALAE